MINVLLVDDHPIVREGVAQVLGGDASIEVIGKASSGEQAVSFCRQQRPDVVLMDLNMPGMGGLEATRKLVNLDPTIKVIVLSMHTRDPYPTQLLRAGARGYLTKGCPIEEAIQAIKAVHNGQRFVSPDIAQQLALGNVDHKHNSPFEELSRREVQVLQMVTEGRNVQDIADQLCLSPKTISTYRYRLFAKLGVKNDVELTRMAMHHGLLDESG